MLHVPNELPQMDIEIVLLVVSIVPFHVTFKHITLLISLLEYDEGIHSDLVLTHMQDTNILGMESDGIMEYIYTVLHERMFVWHHAN